MTPGLSPGLVPRGLGGASGPTLPQVVAWWSCSSTYGTVTTTSASIPADITTWSNNIGVTVVYSGGVYQVRCTTATSRHFCAETTSPVNTTTDYFNVTMVFTLVGSQRWIRVVRHPEFVDFDLVNKTLGYRSEHSWGRVVSIVAGVVTLEFRMRSAAGNKGFGFEMLQNTFATSPAPNYAGSTSNGIDVTSCTMTQIRASAVTDISSIGGANLAQATVDKQPIYGASDWSLESQFNGHPSLLFRTSTTRVVSLDNTTARVLSLGNGVAPAYAVCGVGSIVGHGPAPCYWSGAGGTIEVPLWVDGTELKATRSNGATTSTKTFGSGLASLLATVRTWAVVSTGTVLELWIGGSYRATITHDAVPSRTMTTFSVAGSYATGTTTESECAVGDLSIYSGLPGSTKEERYGHLSSWLVHIGVQFDEDDVLSVSYLFGDPQQSPGIADSVLTIAEKNARSLSAVYHVGIDVVVGHGDWTEGGLEADWNTYVAAVSLHADMTDAARPYWIGCPGNHDFELADVEASFLAATGRSTFDYSVVVGNLRWIVLVSEESYYSVERVTWLSDQLSAAQAAGQTPIVNWHRTLYACNSLVLGTLWDNGWMLPFVDVCEEAHVPVVFVSHAHCYERTVPMKHGVPETPENGGVAHICVGKAYATFTPTPMPTLVQTISYGARSDTYHAADILAAQQTDWLSNDGRMLVRVLEKSSSFIVTAYRIIDTDTLVQVDEETYSLH